MKLKTLILIGLLFAMMSPVVAAPAMKGNGPGGGGGNTEPVIPPPPDGGEPITGNRYAVVIGISDYEGTSSDLTYCDDDAIWWASYLEAAGYTVNLLLDLEATEVAILAALQWLADIEQPGDGVVITYSGHGSYSRTTGLSMLVSADLMGVTSDEVGAITDQIETEHVYLFIDACLAGTFAAIGQAGWLMAIGSTTRTYTYDGTAEMGMGIFTFYMREGLEIPLYIVEDASNYAITHFEADTPGDANLIDAYIGDFYF